MPETPSSLAESFFRWLGIEVTSITTTEVNKEIFITLQTPDSHRIIWVHGKNLDAIKHLLSRIYEKQTGKYRQIQLEVNDYMKAKDERLIRFLEAKIEFVMSTGKTVKIPNLDAFERKKAHHYIAEQAIEGLTTHSEGEGEERALFLGYTGTPVIKTPVTPSTDTKWRASVFDIEEDGIGI